MSAHDKTIAGLLAATAQTLERAGVPTPRVDAEWLLAHTLGARRDTLWTDGRREVAADAVTCFQTLVDRRATREPLQYIVGPQECYGGLFRVASDVLIPRPETELLVEVAVRSLRKAIGRGTSARSAGSDVGRILDIGTGSGCIAITLAMEIPSAHIIATDISPSALAVALENAHRFGVEHRITFIHDDMMQNTVYSSSHVLRPTSYNYFDFVVSNPPYCATRGAALLPPEVRSFEPPGALFGGEDGLDFVRRILKDGAEYLLPGGWLVLEIGDGQAADAKKLLGMTESWCAVDTHKDYGGHERIIVAQRHI